MEDYLRSTTRALAIVVAIAFVFTGAPVIMGGAPVATNAAAQGEDIVNLGWLNFEVQNWNPLKIEMVEDYVVCYLLYNSLFTYDEDWAGPVNDLAVGEMGTDHAPYYQIVHGDGTMSTYVNITHNAYFRNAADPGTTAYNLKASDIVWTFETIMANTGYTFDWYLQDVTAVVAESDYQVRIDTSFEKATLIDDLSGIPILCEDYWITLGDAFGNINPEENFGSSAFMYSDMLKDSWYEFLTAPNYFGEDEYGDERTVKVGGIMYRVYTDSNALVVDMNNGDLDAITLSGDITNYVGKLGIGAGVNIIKYNVNEPGICDIAINAIPETFRNHEGSDYGKGNLLLMDPILREAIMMTLDKTSIVNDYLEGLAIEGDSVVQPGFWHYTPLNQTTFDPAAARLLLEANGYEDWDDNGYLNAMEDSYPVQANLVPLHEPVEGLRCQAPDTDPTYYDVAVAWEDWAALAGIGFVSSQEGEMLMTSKAWYKADYDIWVWHWGWGPEPIGGSISCWLTSEIEEGGDNCQMPMGPWWYGWENYTDAPAEWGLEAPFSAFDQNLSLAQRTRDVDDRKEIINKLQQWVYDSHCENPPYYDLGLYGMTDARFTGWGNWSAHNGRPITSDLLWLWYDLLPAANKPPMFNLGLLSDYETNVDVPVTFTVTVSDQEDDPIMVNWTAGDGIGKYFQNLTGATSTPTTISWSYTYTTLQTGLEAKVTIWDGELNHEVASTATVNVVTPDQGPDIVSMTWDPNSPVYVDQVVDWTVVANDAETGDTAGEFLRITWDWDDGTMDVFDLEPASAGADVTCEVSHSWPAIGDFNVTVYVFDMTYDNIYHNVSAYKWFDVIDNTAPSAPSISSISGLPDIPVPCSATSTDADPDMLTFWWDWGNGTITKDEVQSTSVPGGTPVPTTSSVTHTWTAEGNYLVTVSVDDGNEHNESSTVVAAIWEGPVRPTALGLTQDPSPGISGAIVTLNLSAADANEDALTFYLDLGDGNWTKATTAGGTYEPQYAEVTHTYEVEGTYNVVLYVNDTLFNESQDFDVVIIGNDPPEFTISSTYDAVFNQLFSIQLISASDPDGDELAVWYDWGDDTPLTKGGDAPSYPASHTYMVEDELTLTIHVDDGQGHNVSKTAGVNVQDLNEKPFVSVTVVPSKSVYLTEEELTFTVIVRDAEGDTVTVNMSYGDGALEDEEVELDAGVNETLTFTHTYDAVGTYDWTVQVVDDVLHADMEPIEQAGQVVVEKEDGGLSATALIGIVAVIAIIALVAAFFLMKRKKKAAEDGGSGGMEGMAPPEPPPPTS